MPANTWTPTALASKAKPWAGRGWRGVEAQHKVATLHLVHGALADQALLEDILDEAKPPLPAEAQGLHWLLATPFRYRPLPGGSRFRRREDPGVFYGAEDKKTACAEVGYWRLRLWMDSEGLSTRSKTMPITLFEFHAATKKAIDLTLMPLSKERALWADPIDYTPTQALSVQARESGVEAIRYESVRNEGGRCLALLTPLVFRSVRQPYRNKQENWNLLIQPPGLVVFTRDFTSESWSFNF